MAIPVPHFFSEANVLWACLPDRFTLDSFKQDFNGYTNYHIMVSVDDPESVKHTLLFDETPLGAALNFLECEFFKSEFTAEERLVTLDGFIEWFEL